MSSAQIVKHNECKNRCNSKDQLNDHIDSAKCKRNIIMYLVRVILTPNFNI